MLEVLEVLEGLLLAFAKEYVGVLGGECSEYCIRECSTYRAKKIILY